MPAKTPPVPDPTLAQLRHLGEQIRLHRKSLRVSATATAEAAGMSRVTLHRIEKGEPSVTMGAYLGAMAALGMAFGLLPADARGDPSAIPERIRPADFPQLQQLAWQLQPDAVLTPQEALAIYERNERHLDTATLQARERALIDALRRTLRPGPAGV